MVPPDSDSPPESEPVDQSTRTVSPRRWAWLTRELDRWEATEIISAEQTQRIRSQYQSEPETPSPSDTIRNRDTAAEDRRTSRSRTVLALSLMGAFLVATGIFVYLISNWDSIPTLLRAGLLVSTPIGLFAGGWRLRQTAADSRVGHALWIAASATMGVSLFALNDLFLFGASDELLLAIWAATVILAGHIFTSLPTTVFGLGLGGWTVGLLSTSSSLLLPVGVYGILLIATAGAPRFPVTNQLREAYRLTGATGITISLLWIPAIWPPSFSGLSLQTELIGPLTLFISVILLDTLIGSVRTDTLQKRWLAAIGWPLVSGVVLASAAAATTVASFSGQSGFFFLHLCCLLFLLATIVVGYTDSSIILVNAAIVLFFVQILVFLSSTIVDGLSGPVALVLSGTLLIVIAGSLERGRKQLVVGMRNTE